jgi:phage tail-like protein
MARAQATDPLHSFRYHVSAELVPDLGDPLQPADASGIVGESAQAGFQAVGTPEYTLEMAEYREGTRTFTLKFPGIPSTNDITMSRGVARGDTAFKDWIDAAIEGREYNSDLTIYHGTRTSRSVPYNEGTDFTDGNSKRYILFNAKPARVKPAADLDAATSDVSLAEVDVSFEQFEIALPTGV